MNTDINYIIQKSINGDKKFQKILLKKLHPLIYKNIYKYYATDDNIIEDLVQEGYIIILQSLKNFDKSRNVHFLRYVKINLYYFYKNYYRNTKNIRNTISLNKTIGDSNSNVELGYITKESEIDIIDIISKEESIKDLLANIKKLSKKEQDVINMYYMDELSMTEISQQLNIAYRTAIGRKYNAMQNLKKLMK